MRVPVLGKCGRLRCTLVVLAAILCVSIVLVQFRLITQPVAVGPSKRDSAPAPQRNSRPQTPVPPSFMHLFSHSDVSTDARDYFSSHATYGSAVDAASEFVVLSYAHEVDGALCDYMATHVLQQVRVHILGFGPNADPHFPSIRPQGREFHVGSRLLMQAKACSLLPSSTLVMLSHPDMLLQGDGASIVSAFREAAVDWLPVSSFSDRSASLPRCLAAAEIACHPSEYLKSYQSKYALNDQVHRRLAQPSAAQKYISSGGFMGAAGEALRWLTEAISERPEWERFEKRWNAQGTHYDNPPYQSAEWKQWRRDEPHPPFMRRSEHGPLHDMFLSPSYNVYLDSSSRMWQTMRVSTSYADSTFKFDYTRGQWLNSKSGVYPNYFHFNGASRILLDHTSVSLKRVRNSLLRNQLQRFNRWSDELHIKWLQHLRTTFTAQRAAGRLTHDETLCFNALDKLGTPFPAQLSTAQLDTIDSQCISAVQPVIDPAEFIRFVKIFDRNLKPVLQVLLNSIYAQCNYRQLAT